MKNTQICFILANVWLMLSCTSVTDTKFCSKTAQVLFIVWLCMIIPKPYLKAFLDFFRDPYEDQEGK